MDGYRLNSINHIWRLDGPVTGIAIWEIRETESGPYRRCDNNRAALKYVALDHNSDSNICWPLPIHWPNARKMLLARCWLRRALVSRDINRCLAARQMTARAIQLMALRTGVSLGDMEFRERKWQALFSLNCLSHASLFHARAGRKAFDGYLS